MTKSQEILVGDRITFKAATRYEFRKVTRIVNGFFHGQPTVRYAGSAAFIVRHHEISDVIAAYDRCSACGRASLDCSHAPCDAVIADRAA